ncbi:hypothetical protein VCHA53O466_40467 [Vibrio chagasii]|nr:hypothetical protein VCHA53O466_40467 [Vibrio chagasii]
MKTLNIEDYFDAKLIDRKVGVVSRDGDLVRFGDYQIELTEGNKADEEDESTILNPSKKVYAELTVLKELWMLSLREVKKVAKNGKATLGNEVLMMSGGNINDV